MSLSLLGSRVLIVENPKHNLTTGGIYIPEQSQNERNTGRVVLVGTDVDPSFLHRNVLFNKNARTVMVHEGKECILLYVFDIIATLD